MSSAEPVRLRNLRAGVATVVFSLLLLLFLAGPRVAELLSPFLLYWQAVPALLRFCGGPTLLLAMPLLLLLAATLLSGRVYCSFLCPLGMVQDLCGRRGRGHRRTHGPLPPYALVRYPLFALTTLSALFGSFALLILLDPWSLFSRLAAHLFRPLALAAGNFATVVLERFDIYALSFHRLSLPPSPVLATVLGFGALLLIFCRRYGRAWCNLFCPVGTALGLLSRHSLLRVRLDPQRCNGCGRCEVACKAGCIDSRRRQVALDRCLACFHCLDVCPRRALTFRPTSSKQVPPLQTRRAFLLGTAAAGSAILTAGRPLLAEPIPAPAPVLPPGAMSLVHFARSCTACHLCVSICPTGTLTPDYRAFGDSGLLRPRLDYRRGHCDFACNACGLVCPTGAIAPLALAAKRRTRIGTVRLYEKLCVVHLNKKHCGACGEACPTHAITPVEKGRVLFPKIAPEYCIGCGACEKACPTTPKAITVTAEPVHAWARTRPQPPSFTVPTAAEDKGFPF